MARRHKKHSHFLFLSFVKCALRDIGRPLWWAERVQAREAFDCEPTIPRLTIREEELLKAPLKQSAASSGRVSAVRSCSPVTEVC